MPDVRCDLILLGWTAFVGLNLISDFLWGGQTAQSSSGHGWGDDGGPNSNFGSGELYRGEYRLRANSTVIEEGELRLTLASAPTAALGLEVSHLSMTLRKEGLRIGPTLGMDPDFVFSAVGFGGVGKFAATGAADPQRFPRFGERACKLNAALDLHGKGGKHHGRTLGEIEPSSTAAGGGKLPLSTVVGEVTGATCGFSLVFAAEAVDIVSFTKKVWRYLIWANLITILQIRYVLIQMLHTEDGPSAAKVSVICIAMQALMDAYDSFLHLCLGLSSQYMFNTLAVISLFKFILFSFLEARYLLNIWRQRRAELFGQGWDAMRRELSWLYSRFYGALVIGMMILYNNLDHLDIVVLIFQLYWLPQIIHDTWQGSKSALCQRFIFGISILRTLPILYLWGCPEGIFNGDLFPRLPHAPSLKLCAAVVTIQAAQVAMMVLQQRWGPRWYVPWLCMPWAYNYHRGSTVDTGTDCVICMSELNPEEGGLVVTPCNHSFHQHCLQEWMDVKMECPTCRTDLPPIL